VPQLHQPAHFLGPATALNQIERTRRNNLVSGRRKHTRQSLIPQVQNRSQVVISTYSASCNLIEHLSQLIMAKTFEKPAALQDFREAANQSDGG
jgi:CBS domain containing-hemolysin-like protein